MKIVRYTSTLILVFYLLTLSIGVSFGDDEGASGISLFEYLSGERKSFEQITGAPANLLVVTETTCYSCIKELRAMELLKAKYRDSISISAAFIDRQGLAKVQKYLEFYQFDLDNLLIDPDSTISRKFNVTYIPTLLIFDQNGNETYRKEGFVVGEESLYSQKIDEMIYSKSARRTRRPEPSQESAPKKTTGCASTPG